MLSLGYDRELRDFHFFALRWGRDEWLSGHRTSLLEFNADVTMTRQRFVHKWMIPCTK